MRKTLLFAAVLCTAGAVTAQTGEVTSNRGENWLSQDGDWGLGFEATPLLDYVGNLFNGTQNNGGVGLFSPWSPWSSSTSGGTPPTGVVIVAKKLIDANTAYRGKLRIGFGNQKDTELVQDASSGASAGDMVEDVSKNGNFDIVLGAGLEKRVGSTRVVGIYGGEFYIATHSEKFTKEFGNSIEDVGGSRITEVKGPNQFALGLGVFGGFEWFFAPKMSLGGEYTWGLALSSTGHTETTTESLDANGDGTTETVEGGIKENDFSLDTGVSGLGIFFNVYFQ
jgi:hypothetical protein